MNNKKAIASFELALLVVSLFAFSHLMYASEGVFEELDDIYEEARAENARQIADMATPEKTIPRKTILSSIIGYLKKPMIPQVSAEITETIIGYDDFGQPIILTEETTITNFEISSNSFGSGCCGLTTGGQKCATVSPEDCGASSQFAEGALCDSTSFCQKGCCYDESSGTYDKNVLKTECPKSWVRDPNCNMPAAKLGCCMLGTSSFFETLGQCEVDTFGRALGTNAVVDWREDLNEAGCLILSSIQTEGACVLAGGDCKYGTEIDCLSYQGQFNEGYLCTSPSLNTSCEMTEQTTCVEGRDGVYFLDSCGNYANVYDSSRKDDPTYWNQIVAPEDICGDNDVEGGNAKSKSCGNCNRFLGGICSSASEDNFDVNVGEFYCKDTGCMYDGDHYENGESWCVYDGKIGDGDDIVGSRHWKYVCSQGVTQVEPCADYRNQICVQSNTFEVNGTEAQFRNAACIANNWRECVDLNSQEGGLERCEETLNCRIEKIAIADKFAFSVCTGKYPGGFSFSDERYQETAKKICGMADQTCKVIYKAKTWGGCEIAVNEDCLEEGFAQGMNDLCRALGDCGGAVNVEGVYSENYNVKESPMLGAGAIAKLVAMATPIKGQFAEVEDYTEFLEAAGLIGSPGDPGDGEDDEGLISSKNVNMVGAGMAGIAFAGYAAGFSAFTVAAAPATGIYGATSLSQVATAGQAWMGGASAGTPATSAGMAPFAGAMMGAGIGLMVGFMVAKQMGLSPGGSILMGIGGALMGVKIASVLLGGGNVLLFTPLFFIALFLILIAMYFKAKCEAMNTDVTFECKPWQPPTGGSDCEKCNDDLLKPCSEYRCKSLGAACELVNVGEENEMCHSKADDGKPPVLNPQLGVISEDMEYDDITGGGFSITSVGGGCIEAYTPLIFGVVTNELAQCRFDMIAEDFAEMDFDLGGNSYKYNHTTTFTLPDPSHGQSQGANWTGDITLYVKCRDAFGHENPGFYQIDSCVKEGPDKMGPVIRATNPGNDAIVGFAVSEKNVSIMTNELSTCRWDSSDLAYSAMANSMECTDTFGHPSNNQGYVCSDVLPTSRAENVYYIRCMDQPWLDALNRSDERNPNEESLVYILRKPEKSIEIDWIEPSQDFETNTEMTSIELKVQTSGGGEWHFCSYSFQSFDNLIEMLETGAERIHVQPLNRPAGTDKIYIECKDETGDFVQSTIEFRIIYDTSTPQIARVWQTGATMHVITTEPAECIYTTTGCSYNWINGTAMGNGIEHSITTIAGKKYYIKCKDEFGNAPPGCSIAVHAV